MIVFNPLNHPRTDLVRIPAKIWATDFGLIDAATQQAVPFEHDGEESASSPPTCRRWATNRSVLCR